MCGRFPGHAKRPRPKSRSLFTDSFRHSQPVRPAGRDHRKHAEGDADHRPDIQVGVAARVGQGKQRRQDIEPGGNIAAFAAFAGADVDDARHQSRPSASKKPAEPLTSPLSARVLPRPAAQDCSATRRNRTMLKIPITSFPVFISLPSPAQKATVNGPTVSWSVRSFRFSRSTQNSREVIFSIRSLFSSSSSKISSAIALRPAGMSA